MTPPVEHLLEQAHSLLQRSRYQQALAEAQTALGELERNRDDHRQRALAHEIAGLAALKMGEMPQAEAHLRQALEMIDEAIEPQRVLACQLNMAECLLRLGRLPQARHICIRALSITEANAWHTLHAHTLLILGLVEWQEGAVDEASMCFSRAQQLLSEHEDSALLQRVWSSIAVVHASRGETAKARGLFLDALTHYQNIGDFTLVARCLNNLAGLAYNERDWSRAREYLLQSVSIEADAQDRADLTTSWHNLGLVEIRSNNLKAARKYLNRSFQLAQEISDRASEASALIQLAICSLLESNPEDALNYAVLSRGAIQGSSSVIAALVQWHLPLILLAAGQAETARVQWEACRQAPELDIANSLRDVIDFLLSQRYKAEQPLDAEARSLASSWREELAGRLNSS